MHSSVHVRIIRTDDSLQRPSSDNTIRVHNTWRFLLHELYTERSTPASLSSSKISAVWILDRLGLEPKPATAKADSLGTEPATVSVKSRA